MTVSRAVAAVVLSLLATLAAAQERVSFPSFDGAGNAPVVLSGYFFAAATSPAPAIAMFHGCGGAYDKSGQLSRRMREYAELFNGLGMHVLVVDSLTARYEKELCTQRNGTRRVTQANRRLDALGAIAYLADRADVDVGRIGLIGWSNGGSTVLSASNLHHRDVAAATVKPAFAIAFYPGCESDLKRGYSPAAPLLMLVGQLDDWTPVCALRRARQVGDRDAAGDRRLSRRLARLRLGRAGAPAQGRAERRQSGAGRARRRQSGGVAGVARPRRPLPRRALTPRRARWVSAPAPRTPRTSRPDRSSAAARRSRRRPAGR